MTLSQYYPSYVQHPGYGPPVQYQHMKVVKPSSITWSWDPKGGAELPAMEHEVIKVPVGTPYIGRGAHRSGPPPGYPRVGCTMELVSVLAGDQWTDHPHTTHRALTSLMINTNDFLPNNERQKMLELVPRLLDTKLPIDENLEDLIFRSHQQAYRIGSRASAEMRWAYPVEADLLLRNAQSVLDEFDKRLNRPTRKMDDQTLTQLMMALAA